MGEMRHSYILVLSLIFVFIVGPHASVSAYDLDGTFELAGKLSHKGEPIEGTSHLYISLTPDAARNLYNALDTIPVEDQCTGYTYKGKGNVVYYEINKGSQYLCSFSLNLTDNRVEAGRGGCI